MTGILQIDAKTKDDDRWRQIFSIPAIFAVAVLFFIAVIAISITLLSFYAQSSMVDDLTRQIQDSVGNSFIAQANATLNGYTEWAGEGNHRLSYGQLPPDLISINS